MKYVFSNWNNLIDISICHHFASNSFPEAMMTQSSSENAMSIDCHSTKKGLSRAKMLVATIFSQKCMNHEFISSTIRSY